VSPLAIYGSNFLLTLRFKGPGLFRGKLTRSRADPDPRSGRPQFVIHHIGEEPRGQALVPTELLDTARCSEHRALALYFFSE
jgi:hypothetical protein